MDGHDYAAQGQLHSLRILCDGSDLHRPLVENVDLLQSAFPAPLQVVLEFLLGGEVAVASRARSMAFALVGSDDVSAEITSTAKMQAALCTPAAEAFAVCIAPSSLICLCATKIAEPFAAAAGSGRQGAAGVKMAEAKMTSPPLVSRDDLFIAAKAAGGGHCVLG